MLLKDVNLDKPLNIVQDAEFTITGLATKKYDAADKVLSYIEGEGYIPYAFENKNINAIICPQNIAEKLIELGFTGAICVSDNTRTDFFRIHDYCALHTNLFGEKKPNKIDPSAKIHPTAIIEEHNVEIGKNVVIGAYSVIKSNTVIGEDTVIMEHCVIGTHGFYYYGDFEKKNLVEASGGVNIGRDVVIHTGVIIEKGVFGKDTIICDNVKLDNNVLVSHDCIIGKATLVAGETTLAGHVEIGEDSFVGMGVAATPFAKIGSDALVSAGSVVNREVPDGSHFSGNFAIEHSLFVKALKSKLLGE